MFTILASTFLTATRQDDPATDRRDTPRNPLARVRTGGLSLPPRRGA